jgi:hypothetical protein
MNWLQWFQWIATAVTVGCAVAAACWSRATSRSYRRTRAVERSTLEWLQEFREAGYTVGFSSGTVSGTMSPGDTIRLPTWAHPSNDLSAETVVWPDRPHPDDDV